MTEATQEKTGLGKSFVANYPPFSFWKPTHLPAAHAALNAAPDAETPLGLYLHIPFSRKRCKFCYFRVYTDMIDSGTAYLGSCNSGAVARSSDDADAGDQAVAAQSLGGI